MHAVFQNTEETTPVVRERMEENRLPDRLLKLLNNVETRARDAEEDEQIPG